MSADYGTNGYPALNGTDIAAANADHNKIYIVPNDPTTPTANIMFVSVSDGNNGYTWINLGEVNVSGKFKTGQSLNDISIVQDLNTSEADKVLSANVVFKPKDVVTQLTLPTTSSGGYKPGYVRTSYSNKDGGTNNTFHNTTAYSMVVLSMSGITQVKIEPKSDYYCEYSFLKNNTFAAQQAPTWATGWGTKKVQHLDAGADAVVENVPDDAGYLYLFAGSERVNLPNKVSKVEVIVEDRLSKAEESLIEHSTQIATMNTHIAELDNDILSAKYVFGKDYDILNATGYKGYISSGKWAGTSGSFYSVLVVAVSDYSAIRVTGANQGTYISYIYKIGSGSYTRVDGASVLYADGWTEERYIAPGETVILPYPSVTPAEPTEEDIKLYLYVTIGSSNTNRRPSEVIFMTSVDDKITDLEEKTTQLEVPVQNLKLSGGYKMFIRLSTASTAPNKVYSTDNYGHRRVNVSNFAGGKIRIKTGENGARIAFLKSNIDNVSANNSPDWATGNQQVEELEANTTVIKNVPTDAIYLYCYYGAYSGGTQGHMVLDNGATDYSPTEIYGYGTPTEAIESINDRIDNISEEIGNGTTIFDFNPIKEVANKVHQARRQSGYELATANRAPLWGYAFMHVSDCHGGSDKDHSKEQWGKLMEYAKALRDNSLIDDVVDTGDVIEARFSQFNGNIGRTISDWRADDYGETKKVLTVIGNHDTRGPSSTDTQDNWRDNIGKNVYNVLMADIDEWNVEQPEDAAENGLCYYYKDYTRTVNGTTYTLRALFLDMMGWGYKRVNGSEVADNSQREWVWSVLETARENNMVVAVFCHEVPAEFTSIRSSMSSKFSNKLNANGSNLQGYNPKFKELAYLIHYHMVLGGRFAGYICGHSHTTFVGKISGSVTVDSAVQTLVNTGFEVAVAGSTTVDFDTWGDYYPQRACVVDTTQVGLYRQNTVVTMHDGVRIKETDSEHSFWIVNISTDGVISLIKIGFHLNKYFQKRDVLRIVGRVYGYFSASTEYSAGSIVLYADNKYYRITSKHSENVTWENTQKVEYPFIFDGNYEYAAGNIVSKDGNLWRFLSPAVSNGTTDWAASDKEPYSRVISE